MHEAAHAGEALWGDGFPWMVPVPAGWRLRASSGLLGAFWRAMAYAVPLDRAVEQLVVGGGRHADDPVEHFAEAFAFVACSVFSTMVATCGPASRLMSFMISCGSGIVCRWSRRCRPR